MRFFILCLVALCCSVTLFAQKEMTTAAWLADLEHYQQTAHEKYDFLFVKTTPEAFDAKVEALKKDLPNLEHHEIIAGFARLAASFEYGHTYLPIWDKAIGFTEIPVNLYEFSDGIFLEGVHKDYADALGAKVVKVEGVSVKEALAAIRPIVPAENDQYMKGYGLSYLKYPEVLHAQGVTENYRPDITLTLEKDGRTFNKTFSTQPMGGIPSSYGFTNPTDDWLSIRAQNETPYYLRNLDKNYYYEYLPENKAIYVRYSSVFPDESESIQDFYDRVFAAVKEKEAEKLIIDVRLNGGGNNFNNKHVIKGLIQTEEIDQVGKLFVIVGRRTFSACQNLINEMSNFTNVIFVGEGSGENVNFYGDSRPEVLPNSGLTIRMSWAWWQDKAPWQNAEGTSPQLPVELSSTDYRTNQDPILARALTFDDPNYILDPMGYLSELFISRNIPELQKEAARLAQSPDYAYFDFEGEFIAAGLRLLDSGQAEGATFLLNMTAQYFPQSAAAQSGLAQALAKGGQKDQAKALFQRAVQLDPDGEAGAKAKRLLGELE